MLHFLTYNVIKLLENLIFSELIVIKVESFFIKGTYDKIES